MPLSGLDTDRDSVRGRLSGMLKIWWICSRLRSAVSRLLMSSGGLEMEENSWLSSSSPAISVWRRKRNVQSCEEGSKCVEWSVLSTLHDGTVSQSHAHRRSCHRGLTTITTPANKNDGTFGKYFLYSQK